MIDFATPEQFDAAVGIWTACFGDTEQYARFLFDRLLTPNDVLIHRSENDRTAAMLCFKPFRFVTSNGAAKGVYIFGVATLPEWRNRGFSSALLEELENRLSNRGISLSILVPGGPGLFDFYEKRGYETAISVRHAIVPATGLTGKTTGDLTPIPLKTLRQYRNEFFSNRKRFVDWDESWLDYVDAEARALGGGTYSVSGNGYVVCYPYKDAVIVKEFAVPDTSTTDVLAGLHARFHASEYRFHLSEDAVTGFTSTVSPFAMIKWYDDTVKNRLETATGKPPYMAHVLEGPTLGVPLREV